MIEIVIHLLVKAKEDFILDKDKKKALIRKIVSYFDKENFKVIYREYKFVYSNWFIGFRYGYYS